jgi:calcium/calmodulin-dependent protein kinase (CaM kinase) II
LSQTLLDAIDQQDWETYTELCSNDLTAFEPESRGHLVEGMPFHKFYFDLPRGRVTKRSTISSPKVDVFGETAIITYVRLIQLKTGDEPAQEDACSETRVWVRQDDRWIHVHFHRS